MRPFVLAALVAMSGCSSSAVVPDTSIAPVGTSPTSPNSLPSLTIRLSPIEAYAAGAAGVEVSYPGGAVVLHGEEPQSIPVDSDTMLAASHPGGPSWTQAAGAGAVEQPWRSEVVTDPVALAWQVNGTLEEYLEQLEIADGLDIASPRWWTLDADGALVTLADPDYVPAAAERRIGLWPYVGNGFDPVRTRFAIGTSTARRSLARAISQSAEAAGVAGVNVDFEAFDPAERDDFTAFVAELTRLVHEWGGVTSVDITVLTDDFVDGPEVDSPIFDRRRLAEVSDYLVLMAYDQHSTPRPYGPTASPDWVEDGLRHLLRYADPHQVILGVPFYARIWTLGDPTARAITVTDLIEVAANESPEFDGGFGLDRVILDDGRFFWVEDYRVLDARLDLVDRLGLAGWAAWRLGFDSPDLWRQVSLPGSGS